MSKYINNNQQLIREKFGLRVRKEGLGNIPIILTSNQDELRELFYGIEVIKHCDETLNSILKEVKIMLIRENREDIINKISFKFENGDLVNNNDVLYDVYKKHRYTDNILYLSVVINRSIFSRFYNFLTYPFIKK